LKKINWKDKNGRLHCSLIRDDDDESRPALGIPLEPPPIDSLFEDAKDRLHDELVRRSLFTWKDVQDKQVEVTAAILAVFKRGLIDLYRTKELDSKKEKKQDG
jgi:hypothetical protein